MSFGEFDLGDALNRMSDIVLLIGTDGAILDANPAALEAYGRSLEQLRGLGLLDVSAPQDRAEIRDRLDEAVASGTHFDAMQLHDSGEEFPVEVSATPVVVNGETATLAIMKYMTEYERREVYRRLDAEIRTLPDPTLDLEEYLHCVVRTLKVRTGSDAVGIRLKDGEDFPYASLEGFSVLHMRAENSLLERDAIGGICRDESGQVMLGCTCGLVVSGKGDPILTPGGSFWTDDSVAAIELLGDADPRFHPRNLCVLEGFASIAIVPIRSGGEIVGLIHLADLRKGRYSLESTEQLETIAAHVGEGLKRYL